MGLPSEREALWVLRAQTGDRDALELLLRSVQPHYIAVHTMINDDSSATRLEPADAGAAVSSARPFDDGGFTPGVVLQGRYRIVALIGRGGMGEVYRAQDLKLGQAVALKFLPEEVGREPPRLERFLDEVRIARQISHPNSSSRRREQKGRWRHGLPSDCSRPS